MWNATYVIPHPERDKFLDIQHAFLAIMTFYFARRSCWRWGDCGNTTNHVSLTMHSPTTTRIWKLVGTKKPMARTTTYGPTEFLIRILAQALLCSFAAASGCSFHSWLLGFWSCFGSSSPVALYLLRLLGVSSNAKIYSLRCVLEK